MKASRRGFLHGAFSAGVMSPWAAAAASPDAAWSGGRITHLLPTASHDRLQLKVIFAEPTAGVALSVGGRRITGRVTDAGGEGYVFDVPGLAPDTRYELSLWQKQTRLCDDWSLTTLPAPDATPAHVRLLVYTCAGGHPLMSEGDASAFLPMAVRQRLLERGLAFEPDVVIAIGDQVYWDQRTVLEASDARRRTRGTRLYENAGLLDRTLAAAGAGAGAYNEQVLKAVAGQQITPLYGTRLRSTPCFFVNDDHDYFENDEATDRFVTLPPYLYQRAFAAFVRDHYLPEFLPARGNNRRMTGDTSRGTSAHFGTLRWGRLAEVLMYDCAGHLSLKGNTAGLVPADVEAWLVERTQRSDAGQLLHIPSHPMGWSAGKWREWYPDVADNGNAGAQVAQMGVEGRAFELTTSKPKFMWQSGWWRQHQRLLAALAGQETRAALMLSGDLHATGHGRITQSGEQRFTDNPVNTLIAGPLGTGLYWPSNARGTAPQTAGHLRMEHPAPIAEKNGFSIVDIEPDNVRVRLFAWRREAAPLTAIDTLNAYHDVRIRREGLR